MTRVTSRPAERRAELTTARGAALYIGALLGPGLLLLPGLAAAQAGPASIVAWLVLLVLSGLFAAVFSGLGRRLPQAGGIVGYVAAGLGQRAGRVAGWSFLSGVVSGAPIVVLIGAGYIMTLTGGGTPVRAAVAALLLLFVLGVSAAGLRASARAQLVLVALLIVVVAVAVIGSSPSTQLARWSPFAPHGCFSIGHAATTLMMSFIGWEAVAPLTTRFANPTKQLPRVIAIALAVTTALYLGLAIAIVSVLGPGTTTPLADLLKVAIGPAGSIAAAVAAVVLTVGAVNAYVNGALVMARQLTRPDQGGRAPGFLLVIAAAGLVLISLYGFGLVSTASLVALPTTLFLAVYLGSMLAATQVLRSTCRVAASIASLAVLAILPFCGWALLAPAVVALVVGWKSRTGLPTALPAPAIVPAAPSAAGLTAAGLTGAGLTEADLTGADPIVAARAAALFAANETSGAGSRRTSAEWSGTRPGRDASGCLPQPRLPTGHRWHGEHRQHGRSESASARDGRHPCELRRLCEERPGH
jgi:amino acid efflux transporter